MHIDERSRLSKLVEEAMSRPEPERRAFLDEACASSRERDEALSLLAVLEGAEGAPEGCTEAWTGRPDADAEEAPGTLVGRYRLGPMLGEGGFGQVFIAEQQEPVHRTVALKILRAGLDSREILARFEAERQAMARMDHPGIATVLDAGATPSGRPYFVLELVRGEAITTFCAQARMPLEDRLRLFCEVCAAVQHAHQKGIIHRDLKPSNILVTAADGKPQPKVIDFGVAKATSGRLTERTVFTEFRQFMGTPEYMSPEQTLGGGVDIDTRTDIYSLGVVLFELLTGTTPLDREQLRSASIADLQRLICEAPTPRPSTRLSAIGRTPDAPEERRLECRRLGAALRGDLDWIVLKALDKDRNRRYESAAALAEDVRRYLHHEPVQATPPSVSYRARKFVRRHRVAVVAASIVGVALVGGIIGTSWAMMIAREQRDKAVNAHALAGKRLVEAERAKAEAEASREEALKSSRIASAVTQFFTQDVLHVTPTPAGKPEPTVRELLDAVPPKIDKYFKSDPAVEGIIRERVGQLYRRLGDPGKASAFLADAIPLLEKGLGPDHKQTLSAVHRLGELHMDMEKFDVAAELFRKAYEGRLRAYGVEYHLTMNSLGRSGAAKVYAGQVEEGLREMHEVYEHYARTNGKHSRNAVVGAGNLCEVYLHAGRASEAKVLARETLDIILATRGELAGLEWGVRVYLGDACRMLGEPDEAIAQLDEARRIADSIYPPEHYQLIGVRKARGLALAALRRNVEARAELETAYSIASSVFPATSMECREIARALLRIAEGEGDAEGVAVWRARAE